MAYGDDFSQRYDDDPGSPAARPRVNPAQTKSRLLPPAILLILVAIFGLGGVLFNLTQPPIEEQLETMKAQIDTDPNIAQDDKIKFKELVDDIGEAAVKVQPFLIIAAVIGNLFILIGAVNMLTLSNRGLATIGAVLAMLPVLSGCCCLGIPAGIWALILLGDPEVKAAYAAGSSSAEELPS